MAALRVARPAHAPRARHLIPQVLQLAAALLATGNAYERDGSVFFRGHSAPSKPPGCPVDRRAGTGPGVRRQPRRPDAGGPVRCAGVATIDGAGPGLAQSVGVGPAGVARECAAMAMAAFGASVDLLIGGQDLTFPHHAYQSAMVQAATSVAPFARRAMHVGAVHYQGAEDGEINRKPRADQRSAAQLPAGGDPAAAAEPALADRWEYHEGDLDAATADLETLHAAAGRPNRSAHAAGAVTAALLDDLDIARGVGDRQGRRGRGRARVAAPAGAVLTDPSPRVVRPACCSGAHRVWCTGGMSMTGAPRGPRSGCAC